MNKRARNPLPQRVFNSTSLIQNREEAILKAITRTHAHNFSGSVVEQFSLELDETRLTRVSPTQRGNKITSTFSRGRSGGWDRVKCRHARGARHATAVSSDFNLKRYAASN